MTPAQVLTQVRDQTIDADASLCSDSEIYGYMWMAEQEISALSDGCEGRGNVTLVSGTQEYALPTDAYFIRRAIYDTATSGEHQPLQRVDFRELEFADGGGDGTDSTGEPVQYAVWNDKIILYPIPAAAQAAKLVTLWYVGSPTQITSVSTAFSVNKLFHPYIQEYCLYRVFAKDQDGERANFFLQRWQAGLAQSQIKWMKMKNYGKLHVVKDEDAHSSTELGII